MRGAALLLSLVAINLYAADDPIELDAAEDTFLSSDHTGRPAGRGDKDEMQLYGRADATAYRAMIKFDLKSAPPGFKTALLRVTCWNAHWTGKGSAFVRCHPVTSAWVESEASWDQRTGAAKWKCPGGDWDPKALCASTFFGPLGGARMRTFDFDLTTAARAWQAQPGQNYGVVLMVEKGCTAEMRFRSSEAADGAQKPKLLLYYQKPGPRDSFMLSTENVPPCEPFNPEAPVVQVNGKPATLNLGEQFETKFSASGAKEPYMFSAATAAIPGLSLSPDGTLKGKPSKAGSFIFGVACTSSNGKKATDWQRWIVVDPNAKPPVVAAKDEEPKKADAAPEKKVEKPIADE
jgi:hypothetical protein